MRPQRLALGTIETGVMNFVRMRKWIYPLYLLTMLVFSFGLIYRFQSPQVTLGAMALLFLPGRIQGYFFRDFYSGRKLMGVGEYEKASAHFLTFAQQMKESPWKRHLVWLTFVVNTTDIRAMTLNNLGACHIELGHFSNAEEYLLAAVSVDPKYPMPYVNRGRMHLLKGDREAAEASFRRAKALGYDGSAYDKLLTSLGQRLADFEGATQAPTEEKFEGF